MINAGGEVVYHEGSHNVCSGHFCCVYKAWSAKCKYTEEDESHWYIFSRLCCLHTPAHTHVVNGVLPWWSAQSTYIWWTGLQHCNMHKQEPIMVSVFLRHADWSFRLCWSPWWGMENSVCWGLAKDWWYCYAAAYNLLDCDKNKCHWWQHFINFTPNHVCEHQCCFWAVLHILISYYSYVWYSGPQKSNS